MHYDNSTSGPNGIKAKRESISLDTQTRHHILSLKEEVRLLNENMPSEKRIRDMILNQITDMEKGLDTTVQAQREAGDE